MIKRYEVQPQLKVRINQDIPGLRKKKTAFSPKPANSRWWAPFSSYERNGILNIGLSRNWVRLCFPIVPMFLFTYMWMPVIHGTIYINHFNNYQWEGVYYKYSGNRMVYVDNTITRLAWSSQDIIIRCSISTATLLTILHLYLNLIHITTTLFFHCYILYISNSG